MPFVTNDGLVIEATEPGAIVTELRRASRTPIRSNREFMRRTARLARGQTGVPIRSTSVELFVADLLQAGLLKEAKD